jgi:endogenous inhibitor of DNA gyrase (YacG/DUF329 family)
VHCAICDQPLAHGARPPFCSERCRLLDLGRWLDGGYRVPLSEHEAHAGEPSELEPQEHPCDD